MDQFKINKILGETEQGYDIVARKFSSSRNSFWDRVKCVRELAKNGDKILDFGCGDGSLLDLFSGKNIEYFGVDASEKFIEMAKRKYNRNYAKFQRISSFERLPFPDNYFNVVYAIAVFHHFPSVEYRKKMAQELYRVTKSGGYVIATVWNLWQKKYIKNILRNWKDKLLAKSDLDWNDCRVDFKNDEGKTLFKRYHHAFTQRELDHLFREAGFAQEECKLPKNWNLIFAGEK